MELEQQEALRAHFSYFSDDLAVVQWDTAFVYDRRESAAATLDILEFANTQLVELRTYDKRLDDELDTIYKLDHLRPVARFGRKHAQNAADRLRYLIVDILELTDRANNALKIIGDAYYARLYRGAAGRLGLTTGSARSTRSCKASTKCTASLPIRRRRREASSSKPSSSSLIGVEIVVGVLALHH